MQTSEANRIYRAKIPYSIDGGTIYDIRIDTLLESIFLFIKTFEEEGAIYYCLHIKRFRSLTYDFDLNLPPSCTFFWETNVEQKENLYYFEAIVGLADSVLQVYCEDLELKKIATFYSEDGEK